MARERCAVVGAGAVLVGTGSLAARLSSPYSGLMSFGLCGALHPALRPGDVVLGRSVHFGDERLEADPAWLARLARHLHGARIGDVAGSPVMVTTARDKANLRGVTGALVVDMESHAVALAARDAGLPFAIVRAVSDAADRDLPHAAQAGFSQTGEADIGAVSRALTRRPWELPALIRVAIEAERGFRALDRAGRLLEA